MSVIVTACILPTFGQDNRLHTAIKSSTVFAKNPDDPILYPDDTSSMELLRFRLMFKDRINEWLDYDLAYEHRMRWTSSGATAGTAQLLPSAADAPYRIHQWDWQISEKPGQYGHWHEIDRLALNYHPKWGNITVGRQAIGLGRGVIFSAVDLFAPFSPLEVDREWRRGVDAARLEAILGDTSSVEWISAFGNNQDTSAHILRARGYWGDIDAEVVLGKRAEDDMLGTVVSGNVGDAEVHTELAVFHTPERQIDDGLWGNDHLVGKAVFGSSYTFDIGEGVTVLAEYHYSGFGIKDSDDLPVLLASPTFQARYLRGDTQILSRQAVAAQLTYPVTDDWSSGLLVIGSPQDGSGIISPTLSWDISDECSATLSLFIPWGEESENGQLNSAYGGSPTSVFLQLNYHF